MKKMVVIFLLFFAIFATSASAAGKIQGGNVADPLDWPAQFALVESGKSAVRGQFCGSTLIASRWILTAAHCVYDAYWKPLRARDIDVVYGADLRIEEERLDIEKIIIHPSYKKYRPDLAYFKASDLALLKTKTASSRPPLPLSSNRTLWSPGKEVSTAGWGALDIAWYPTPLELRDVSVYAVSDKYCSSKRIYGREFIPKRMICAGVWQGGKDTCFGDSGGPLVSYFADQPYLVGITSWGGGSSYASWCGSSRYPGVYSEVHFARGWIDYYLQNSV